MNLFYIFIKLFHNQSSYVQMGISFLVIIYFGVTDMTFKHQNPKTLNLSGVYIFDVLRLRFGYR